MNIRREVALEVEPEPATVANLRAMVEALEGVDGDASVWLDRQEDGERAAVAVTWWES